MKNLYPPHWARWLTIEYFIQSTNHMLLLNCWLTGWKGIPTIIEASLMHMYCRTNTKISSGTLFVKLRINFVAYALFMRTGLSSSSVFYVRFYLSLSLSLFFCLRLGLERKIKKNLSYFARVVVLKRFLGVGSDAYIYHRY